MISRSVALGGIEILRTGTGRRVSAYAAVFDQSEEMHDDPNGPYLEVIDPRAFDQALRAGTDGVYVLFNHGRNLEGTPDVLGSVPIGKPVAIKADRKGLHTVTEFNRSRLADSVLESIKAGDLRGYSFRGRMLRSNPSKLPRTRSRSGQLPTVRRLELSLIEYGPTPSPAFPTAGVVSGQVA